MADHESRDPGQSPTRPDPSNKEDSLFDRKLELGFGDGVLYGVALVGIALIGFLMGVEEGGRAAAIYGSSVVVVFLFGIKLGAELKPKDDES